MPRKRDKMDRFTLRVGRKLAVKMNKACDRLDVTQREFLEDALVAYCASKPEPLGEWKPELDVYRTGIWIDPQVMSSVDDREALEEISQRELMERAITLKLGSIGGRA
jgi:hypothetical protein